MRVGLTEEDLLRRFSMSLLHSLVIISEMDVACCYCSTVAETETRQSERIKEVEVKQAFERSEAKRNNERAI